VTKLKVKVDYRLYSLLLFKATLSEFVQLKSCQKICHPKEKSQFHLHPQPDVQDLQNVMKIKDITNSLNNYHQDNDPVFFPD